MQLDAIVYCKASERYLKRRDGCRLSFWRCGLGNVRNWRWSCSKLADSNIQGGLGFVANIAVEAGVTKIFNVAGAGSAAAGIGPQVQALEANLFGSAAGNSASALICP